MIFILFYLFSNEDLVGPTKPSVEIELVGEGRDDGHLHPLQQGLVSVSKDVWLSGPFLLFCSRNVLTLIYNATPEVLSKTWDEVFT
jgi:hypothetical protein